MFFEEYCMCDTCTMFFFTCVLGMYSVAAVCTSEHGAHNSGAV